MTLHVPDFRSVSQAHAAASMSDNGKFPSGNFDESSQLTNWILYYGAMCHMTPEVSDFVAGSLEYTDKHIEVTDGYHVTAKQKGQVQIKMCDNNGYDFIETLYNVLLEPDLCDRLFSIITLMDQDIIFYSKKVFARCTLDKKRKMWLHYHIVHKGNIHFGGK